MMVLDDKCKKCHYACNAIYLHQNFENWTSGNKDIDKFIQDTQLSDHKNMKVALEWIPYDRFNNINYVAKDEFGKEYKANWVDGHILYWNVEKQNWDRYGKN